jgi:phage tail sheath protein FI
MQRPSFVPEERSMRRLFVTASLFAACLVGLVRETAAQQNDTPKAAATRKLLKTKVSVDYKETTLSDVIDDIKDQIKEKSKKVLGVRVDNKGGVSNNTKFTYKAEDKPLDEVLDEMFKKNDIGYIVISQQGTAYDGTLLIVKGSARGYPAKK